MLTSPGDSGELRPLTEKIRAPLGFDEIVGSSPTFRAALAIAAKAARARVPILIEGESGVGKEVIAHAIHTASPRARMPMITVNCGAIPPSLVESDLFGHERGAFTGAFDRHIGKFMSANGGTIFLDEISELPLEAQVKLLRVLQEGESSRSARACRCRSTCASSRRPTSGSSTRSRPAVSARISITASMWSSSLSRRCANAPATFRRWPATCSIASVPSRACAVLASPTRRSICSCATTGRAMSASCTTPCSAPLCSARGDALTPADFPQLSDELFGRSEPRPRTAPSQVLRHAQENGIGVTLYEANGHLRSLSDIEADVIRLAIGHYRGRMTEVARRLGIGRSTLYRKLAELGIDTAA